MRGVILFDIDGTLVDCGGAGRRAMNLAFQELFQRQDACQHISFGGMTDRAIVRAALLHLRVEVEAWMDRVLATYLQILARDLPRSDRFRELDGGRGLAQRARAEGFEVGLGTGNIREGARLKLERAALWELFDFGGFGCDGESRDVVLGRGRERGARRAAVEPERCPTVVIGDTPLDVAAAHAIGARCLAVTTGQFAREALESAGADVVVASLSSEEAWPAVVELSAVT